jgi:hypothetical protein
MVKCFLVHGKWRSMIVTSEIYVYWHRIAILFNGALCYTGIVLRISTYSFMFEHENSWNITPHFHFCYPKKVIVTKCLWSGYTVSMPFRGISYIKGYSKIQIFRFSFPSFLTLHNARRMGNFKYSFFLRNVVKSPCSVLYYILFCMFLFNFYHYLGWFSAFSYYFFMNNIFVLVSSISGRVFTMMKLVLRTMWTTPCCS